MCMASCSFIVRYDVSMFLPMPNGAGEKRIGDSGLVSKKD